MLSIYILLKPCNEGSMLKYHADVAELVDAPALGAGTERYGSSSLPIRTIMHFQCTMYFLKYLQMNINLQLLIVYQNLIYEGFFNFIKQLWPVSGHKDRYCTLCERRFFTL